MNAIRLLTSVIVLSLLAGCLSTRPENPRNLCSMFEERRSWYNAAEDARDRWGVPVPVTMAFIYHESGYQARARPERTRLLGFIPWFRPSSARGYAQALDGTWREYQEQAGSMFSRRTDFSDAVDFIGWYNHLSYQRNNIARDDARDLYLAYHEGHGGYSRGTYREKGWLLEVAANVQRRADQYEQQYARCREDLARPWWQRIFL